MNSLQAIMMAVFGVIVTIFLLVSMTEKIEAGVAVKMNARLEHLADDVANAVQHLSSSTIDSAAETFDVDIKDISISLEDNRFVTVKHGNTEFTDQFHISKGIIVVDSTVSDVSSLCFVKDYDEVSKSSTITMRPYKDSPCDTEYKEVDLRYDWDWGFEGEQQINGTVETDQVVLDSALPIGKIKDAAFYNFNIDDDSNYFKIKPRDLSRYFAKFDLRLPLDPQAPTGSNSVSFTIDVSPLHAIDTDVIYLDWHIEECDDVERDYQCIIRDGQEITFNFSAQWRPDPPAVFWWANITLFNTRATKDFYDWGFVDTKSFFNKTTTDYPNGTVGMVTFHNFTTPELEYINMTPGDFGRNYFSFGLLVPDDDNENSNNNVSLTLSVLPFYSMNVDVKDMAKTVPECFSLEKPCFRRLGSEIMLEFEPGTYNIIVEDPVY